MTKPNVSSKKTVVNKTTKTTSPKPVEIGESALSDILVLLKKQDERMIQMEAHLTTLVDSNRHLEVQNIEFQQRISILEDILAEQQPDGDFRELMLADAITTFRETMNEELGSSLKVFREESASILSEMKLGVMMVNQSAYETTENNLTLRKEAEDLSKIIREFVSLIPDYQQLSTEIRAGLAAMVHFRDQGAATLINDLEDKYKEQVMALYKLIDKISKAIPERILGEQKVMVKSLNETIAAIEEKFEEMRNIASKTRRDFDTSVKESNNLINKIDETVRRTGMEQNQTLFTAAEKIVRDLIEPVHEVATVLTNAIEGLDNAKLTTSLGNTDHNIATLAVMIQDLKGSIDPLNEMLAAVDRGAGE